MALWSRTYNCDTLNIILGTSTFLTIIQVVAVITSFLSLCYGFVTWRQVSEEMDGNTDWTWKDMAVDMVWNILSVSPRVIALAVFASFQLYWFWGLVITQILITFIVSFSHFYRNDQMNSIEDFFDWFLVSSFLGMGSIFTMFAVFTVTFQVYLLYWVVMFIENTVMISIWYQWSSDFGLWYHDWAISFVITAYVVSLIIKCVHCYFYEPNRDEQNIYVIGSLMCSNCPQPIM